VVVRKYSNIGSFAGSVLVFIFLSLIVQVSQGATPAIELPKEAVSKKVLDNGLTVLAKKSPPANLVVVDVKISAGSSLEGEYTGSGISHLVEHMIFKGTDSRGPGAIEKEVKSYGGIINGSVSQDITDYSIVLPSKNLPQAMSLLKDMLSNAKFDATEIAMEREVILDEIRMNKDEPNARLSRLLNETAYLRHPYRHPPIGYEARLAALKKDDLVKYYKKMYVPNRIVISVVGGVESPDAIAKVEKEFDSFRPPDYSAAGLSFPEPPQIATRRLDDEKDVNLAYIAMGFHSTSLLDRDLFAMDVLSMILGRGDNSRLPVLMVRDKRVAHSVSSWNYTPRDPGLFAVTAVVDKENLDIAERSVMEEIEKVRRGYVTEEELEAARRMVLSDFVSLFQTIAGQANTISMNYVFTGDTDFSRIYLEGVQAVTKEDVRRVAEKYLSSDNLTVVRIVPKGYKKDEAIAAQPEAADVIRMQVLKNGLRVLIREDRRTPTIAITVAMLGGLMVESKDDNGISGFTARMLLRGTKTRKEYQIRGVIEKLGGSMSAFSGFNSFGVNLEMLKPDLGLSLDILKDILANSEFSEDQIDREKVLTLAAIRQEDDDIFETGVNTFRKALFENSPYAFRYIGEETTVRMLKRTDLASFYKNYCVSNNMVISVSGDVDSGALMGKIAEKFSDLGKKDVRFKPSKPPKLSAPRFRSVEMDREQALLVMGFETTTIKDRDRYALEVLSSVLSGQSGRMFNELRNKLSLAYALGCFQKLSLETGFFAFYVATTSDSVPAAKSSLVGEIAALLKKGVAEEELEMAKKELVSRDRIEKQMNSFFSLNSALDELNGLGYDNLYKYESEIGKVTRQDLIKAAVKYFNLNAYAEAVVSSK